MSDGRPTVWVIRQIDRHANAIIFLLLVVSLLATVWAMLGWSAARNAQHRLTSVEARNQAEDLGKQVADVTTCFNQAKNRPRLVIILRGISVELEPLPRDQLQSLIDDYSKDTPTVVRCVALARKYKIDPEPYLKNPPSEAGNGESK